MPVYHRRGGIWYEIGQTDPIVSSVVVAAVITALAEQVGTTGAPGSLGGAARPGTTSYSTPADAIIVATNGVDTNVGTLAAPVATLTRAQALVASGGTIAFRGGVYHQGQALNPTGYTGSVGFQGYRYGVANTTIQSYLNEPVWFDGSTRHTGWVQSGTTWTKNITITFDRGHTDSYGKLDDDVRGEGWTWVRPDFPLAANPEMIFIDDVELTQVATQAALVPGSFFVAGTNSGTNNVLFTTTTWYIYPPAGKNPNTADTRVTDLFSCLTASAVDVTFKGIGVRRYANSNSQGGAVKANFARFACQNIYLEDVATVGFSLFQADGSSFTNCEAQRAGILGFHAHNSYNLVYSQCKAQYANIRRFYWAPVSGGAKLTACRNIRFDGCNMTYNWSKGIWFDASNYNADILNSALDWNEQFGCVYEIGAVGVLANCTLTNTGKDGILWHDTHDLQIWNCTFKNNGRLRNTGIFDDANPRNIKVYQDDRRSVTGDGGTYPGYGRDPRQPIPDPTMNNWVNEKMGVHNCIIDQGNLQFAYMPVEDLQKNDSPAASRDFSLYGYTGDGNLYSRASTANPANGWAWLRPGTGTAQTVVTTFAQWKSVNGGQDLNSVEVIGASPTDGTGFLTASAAAIYGPSGSNPAGVPIPAAIAAKIGVPAGTVRVGPITSSASQTWQSRLNLATTTTPRHIYIGMDSIAYGAAAFGNTPPKWSNSFPGQLATSLAASYGNAGTGAVLANPDTRANPTWDPRFGFGGSITNLTLGWHKYACWSTAAGAANYIEFTTSCTEFVVFALAETAGIGRFTIDGAGTQTFRIMGSGGTTPDIDKQPGLPAGHIVVRLPAGALGTHTLRVWTEGVAGRWLSFEGRTGAGRFIVDNLSISNKALATMGFVNPSNTDDVNGTYGLPVFDTSLKMGPGIAMLALTMNEWTTGTTLAVTTQRVDAEIARVQALGIDSFGYISPQPDPSIQGGTMTYTQLVTMVRARMAANGIPLLDHWKLFAAQGGTDVSGIADEAQLYALGNSKTPDLFADTLHPTNAGSALIAASMRTFLGL